MIHKKTFFALASDANFLIPLVVSLTSISRNCREPIFIVVFTTDIPVSIRSKIGRLFDHWAPKKSTLEWIEMDTQCLAGFPLRFKHISPLAYARLFTPRLLADRKNELIYLDCDTLITGDVNSWLEREPLNRFPVAAVQDFIAPRWNSPAGLPYLVNKVEGSDKLAIFNSGVLRINVPAWIELRAEQSALDFIKEHGHNCKSDQDALNFVFRGQWQRLHPKWNLQSTLENGEKISPELQASIDNVSPADDAIIHFCTRHKPWNSGLRPNPFIKLWLAAFCDSGWFTPAEFQRWKRQRWMNLFWRSLKRRLVSNE